MCIISCIQIEKKAPKAPLPPLLLLKTLRAKTFSFSTCVYRTVLPPCQRGKMRQFYKFSTLTFNGMLRAFRPVKLLKRKLLCNTRTGDFRRRRTRKVAPTCFFS